MTNGTSYKLYDLAWALLLLCVFISFIYILAYGIDITDEGYYLQTVSAPFSELYGASQFGFILRPFWLLTNENIYLYRVLLWTLQLALAFTIFQGLVMRNLALSAIKQNLLAASFSLLILGYLYDWLPTASYNTLALIAVQLFCIAYIRVSGWTITRGILIGIAGTLAFLTKQPLAIFFILISAVAAMFFLRSNTKNVITSMSVASLVSLILVTVFALFTHGSLLQFYLNLNEALILGNTLFGSVFKWASLSDMLWRAGSDWCSLGTSELRFIALNGALFFISPFMYSGKLLGSPLQALVSRLLLAMTCIWVLAICVTISSHIENSINLLTLFDRFLLTWFPPLCMLIGLAISGALSKQLSLRDYGLASLLLLMPYSFTFGTSLAYLHAISIMYAFAYASCVALIKDVKLALPMTCLLIYGLCIVAASMPFSGRELYRQPALWGDNKSQSAERIANGPLKGLVISEPVAEYFDQLSYLAYENGFERRDGIIDLTGASPGAIFAIGAKSVGAPWLIGKYPGSNEVAKIKLGKVNKLELKKSWVLYERWHRSISPSVLEVLNRTLEQDYIEVGSVMLPERFGGRVAPNRQTLYRPKPTIK